jgi:hypothetical protein
MITFDIKDLYVNIPIDETLNIIKIKLQQNNDTETTHQILAQLEVILSKIYFTFQQKIYQPEQAISMGSLISSLIAEISLQNYEDTNVKQFLESKSIIFYVQYVDDILIIFDKTKISPQIINTHINKLHNNIKLNPTYEEHRSINFLKLTIRCQQTILGIDIYRKPTTTNTTINFLSNHPIEQKMAAFRSHITRRHSLPLIPDKKQKEWKNIQLTARNNNFPKHLLQKLKRQTKQKTTHTQPKEKNYKIWTTFTYHSPKIRKITNLFKNTNIGIAFKAATISQYLVRITPQTQTPVHEKSGVYKITCNTCQKAYVGQTSHDVRSRFRERILYIRNNDPRSAYALHILNCRHEYGNINDTMTLLKQINKPNLLLPYEQMYI